MPFYFFFNIKYLGIFFIKDDAFVTLAVMFSLVSNFLSRVFFGNLVKRLNFFNTCALLGALSIVCDALLVSISLVPSKGVFLVFIALQGICGSMVFNLNYVSCYEIFSKERALHLLKVFDLSPILGMALCSLLNSYLAQYARMRYMLCAFIGIDLLGILGIKMYQYWLEGK